MEKQSYITYDVVDNIVTGRILPQFPKYVICENGKIYSLYVNRYIGKKCKKEYKFIKLTYTDELGKKKRQSFSVHKLVALAFHDNPNGYTEIDHKDNDKHNNCVNNLEWVTHPENIKRSHASGKRKLATATKKPVYQYNGEIFVKKFDSAKDASIETGYNKWRISSACENGKIYKDYSWRYENEEDVENLRKNYPDEEWRIYGFMNLILNIEFQTMEISTV